MLILLICELRNSQFGIVVNLKVWLIDIVLRLADFPLNQYMIRLLLLYDIGRLITADSVLLFV